MFLKAEHLLSQARACYTDLHRATARERYELLLQRCPGIVEHLDLQDIASFLNVTPKTISMIRKNITFGKDKPHNLQKLLTWVKTFTLGGRFPVHAEGEFVINAVTLQGYTW